MPEKSKEKYCLKGTIREKGGKRTESQEGGIIGQEKEEIGRQEKTAVAQNEGRNLSGNVDQPLSIRIQAAGEGGNPGKSR